MLAERCAKTTYGCQLLRCSCTTVQLHAEDACASAYGVNRQNRVCSCHALLSPACQCIIVGFFSALFAFCYVSARGQKGLGTAVTLHVLSVLGEFEPFFPAAGRESAGGATLSCPAVTGCYRLDPKAQSQDTISFCPFTFSTALNKNWPVLLLCSGAKVSCGVNRCLCNKCSQLPQSCEGPSLPPCASFSD